MNRERLDQVRLAMMVINAAKDKPETSYRGYRKLGLNY